MGGTRSFGRSSHADTPTTALTAALVGSGPWVLDGKHKPLFFFGSNRAEGPWGPTSWWEEGDGSVALQLCGGMSLRFDSTTTAPTSFTYTSGTGGGGGRGGGRARPGGGKTGKGAIDESYAAMRVWSTGQHAGSADHPAVAELIGHGPWAWSGIAPMAFLHGGALHSPWGPGSYWPLEGSSTTVIVEFVGSKHRITPHGCMKFSSVRETDGERVDAWVQVGQPSRGCEL